METEACEGKISIPRPSSCFTLVRSSSH